MIHGYCLGGGVALALDADIRVADDRAQFGIPAARIGAGYPVVDTARLVSAVGPGAAADLLCTGRRIDAGEALRLGLVQRVVPQPDLEATVRELASNIEVNAPLSVQASKASILHAVTGEDADRAAALVERCRTSSDFAEGVAAFAEQRSPVFRGR
jgi:enoyl-CoA hydratase/carnithine racemase